MRLSDNFFSPDYFAARDRFREAAARAGARMETLPLDAKGPAGESLGIDVAWLGAGNPRRVLLHSSGLHGIEGFAGSAIQLQLLTDLPKLPDDTGLIIVHVLNPYGMSWLRRTNESNVDLNRNFPGDGKYAGAPAAYGTLNSFLNPPTQPRMDLYTLKAGWLVLRYGMPALKLAILRGQYEYPNGLFFGGKHLEQTGERYQAFLSTRLASAERVIAFDVHTAIGDYGEDLLMVQPGAYPTLRQMFGDRVVPPDAEKTDSYPTTGSLDTLFARVMPKAQVFAVTQEFGTYSPMKVLHALREENRWHHYGARTINHPTKEIMKETFCPQDEAWRQAVLKRGAELLKRGFAQLQQ